MGAPHEAAEIHDSTSVSCESVSRHNAAMGYELHIMDIFHKSFLLVHWDHFVVLRHADTLNVVPHLVVHVTAEQLPQMLDERVGEERLPLALIVIEEDVKVALPKIIGLPTQ